MNIIKEIETDVNNGKEYLVETYLRTVINFSNKANYKINYTLLTEMILNMDDDNIVYTGTFFKTKLKKKHKISDKTIQNSLYELNHSGLIKRLDTSTYYINSVYFGKSNFKTANECQLIFEYKDKQLYIKLLI